MKGELNDQPVEAAAVEHPSKAEEKWCSACKCTHPLSAFNKDSSRSSGLAYVCREVLHKRQVAWRLKQKEKRTAAASGKRVAQPGGAVAGTEAPHGALPPEPVRPLKAPVEKQEAILVPFDPIDRILLRIDLTNHAEVYRRLSEIAEQEIRTPEGQALYWLRQILEGAEVRLDG